MDLNRLREQLRKSRPVRVTRTGRLESDESSEQEGQRDSSPSRLKRHTFAEGRLERDQETLLAHSRARPLTFDGQPAFEEVIETDFDITFHLVMVVSQHYPVIPPKVFCLEPRVPHVRDLHVYSNGALCLFEPREWNTRLTLLDVRNWACEWAFNIVPKLSADHDWMSPEHAE